MLGEGHFSHWRGGHSQCKGRHGDAPVVKLVNTLDLKSNGDYSLPVQVRLGALPHFPWPLLGTLCSELSAGIVTFVTIVPHTGRAPDT